MVLLVCFLLAVVDPSHRGQSPSLCTAKPVGAKDHVASVVLSLKRQSFRFKSKPRGFDSMDATVFKMSKNGELL